MNGEQPAVERIWWEFFIARSSSFAVLSVAIGVSSPTHSANIENRIWDDIATGGGQNEHQIFRRINSFIFLLVLGMSTGEEEDEFLALIVSAKFKWTCYWVNSQQQRATIMSPLLSAPSRWQSGIDFFCIAR